MMAAAIRLIGPIALSVLVSTGAASAEPAESDLPPVGTRSLFDYVFVKDVPGGTAQYDIPTSFEGVLERMRKVQSGEPLAVSIPMGRSVQRFETDLKNPRNVAAFSANSRVPYQGRLLPALTDRLFVGYGKQSDQLEVISYNQDAGRYEFQLVKNLTKAGQQQVMYAPREFCASCHIHRVPMFPRDPWEETTAFPATSVAVGKAMGFGASNLLDKRYLGVPIAFTNNSVAYAIDRSIDSGASQITFQRVWQDACKAAGTTDDGAAAVDAIGCRARLLKLGFRYMFNFSVMPNSPEYLALKTKLLPGVKSVFGELVRFPVSDLRSRNPLTAEGGYDPTNGTDVQHGVLASNAATIELLRSRTSIPKAFDPLVANPGTDDPYMYHPLHGVPLSAMSPSGYQYPDYRPQLDQPRIRKSDDAKLLNEVVVWVSGIVALDRTFYAPLKTAGATGFDKIDLAIKKMEDAARADGKGVLAGDPLTADKVVQGIGKHATGQTFSFLVSADRSLPPPKTEAGGPVTPEGEFAPHNEQEATALTNFKALCGACHGTGAAIELFPGDYRKMNAETAAKVLRRIDWERCKPEPNRTTMPPASSPGRKKICQTPAARANMIAALRGRVFGSVAKPCGEAFTLATPLSAQAVQTNNCPASGSTP